jgi:hypothetical protein
MADELPELGSKEAAELFIALYQAHFGPHPAARAWRSDDAIATRERKIWRAEIDRIEPRHMEQVIELMALDARERERGGKPKVSDVRTARLKIESRYATFTPGGAPRDDCCLCYGSGAICVPAAAPDATRKAWVIGDPTKAVLHDMAFPCRCTAGKQQAAHLFRFMPADVAARAWDYLQAVLAECGEQDGDRPVSLREYLARAAPEGLSARALMTQALIDSLRMDAERRGQDVSHYPSGAPSETAERLAARILRGETVAAASAGPRKRAELEPIGGAVDDAVPWDDPVERAAIQGEAQHG